MITPENAKTAVVINAVIFLDAEVEDIATPGDYNEIFCDAFGLEDTPFIVDYQVNCDVVEVEPEDTFFLPRRHRDWQYYSAKSLVCLVAVALTLFVLFGWQG